MIRTALLLLVALTAGALFAQDRNDDLRARVVEMRRELTRISHGARAERMITRVYDLGGLVDPVIERDVDLPDLERGTAGTETESDRFESLSAWVEDSIVEAIVDSVGPTATVESVGGNLLVTGTADEQRRVRRTLKRIQSFPRRRYAVEVRIISAEAGDADRLRGVRRVRPEAVDAAWARRTVLGAIRFACAEAIQTPFGATHAHGLVWDYDVEVAREATIGEPQPSRVADGVMGHARVDGDPRANGAKLHLELQWQRMQGAPRGADTQHGPLSLPTLDVVRLQTSFWVPVGRTVLAASCTVGVTPCHVLVRVRALE